MSEFLAAQSLPSVPAGDDLSATKPLHQRVLEALEDLTPSMRCSGLKEASEAAKEMGKEEAVSVIVPAFLGTVKDNEASVRQTLADRIVDMAQTLVDFGAQSTVVDGVIPALATLCRDRNQQVRAGAAGAVVSVSKILPFDAVEQTVIPQVVRALATDESDEEFRAAAAQMLGGLASIIAASGSKPASAFLLDQVSALSSDPVFRVRKSIASSLAPVCESSSQEVAESVLLPIFLRLSADSIWGVRKACAESMPAMANSVSLRLRAQEIVPVFRKLVQDTSRWVRCSAYQSAGPLISLLDSSQIDHSLLSFFTDMALEGTSSRIGDSDIRHYCAFSFPAVLLALKKERWPELKETYLILAVDLQWKVRRSISFSLHEVAKIVGTEIAESCLASVFDAMLHDLDEVRVGAIAGCAKFLSVINPQSREKYLSVITELRLDQSWRVRKMLAKQLGELAALFESPESRASVLSLAMQLAGDSVSSVRRVAAISIGEITTSLTGDSKNKFISEIRSLAVNDHYASRQLYLLICQSLITRLSPDEFCSSFLDDALKLHTDRVALVRASTSRFIAESLMKHDAYAGRKDVQAALEILQTDKDRDVVFNAQLATARDSN